MVYLTRISLFRRPLTLVAALLLMVVGGVSLTQMQREFLPDIEFPIIIVASSYPDADTETVLNELTIPLEAAFDGVGESQTVRSTTGPGFSQIVAEYEFGLDMAALQAEVERNIAALSLPEGASAPFTQRLNPDAFPVLRISLLGDQTLEELGAMAENEVVPALSAVEGVGSVDLIGLGGGISRTNGKPSVTISVLKSPDANTVETSRAVRERMDTLRLDGAELVVISDQAPAVEASLNGLAREGALGGIFAIVMIFLFLTNLRATFVIAISIPLSVLVALLIMERTGFTLNILTTGGLAISMGRVVDDAIVVLENIFRHTQKGEGLKEAALSGTREVATAITSSTLATVAVFLPLTFVSGFIGVIFVPFAYTVTFALVASLIVALTVVPALSSMIVTKQSVGEERQTRLQSIYVPMLRWALGHRLITIIIAIASFVLSIVLIPFVPVGFFPSAAERILDLNVALPRGADISDTESEIILIEGVLAESPLVTAYLATAGSAVGGAGGGFGGGGGANRASFFVRLHEDTDVAVLIEELEPQLNEAVSPGTSVVVSEFSGGGPDNNGLELVISGDSQDAIANSAERILDALEASDLSASVTNLNTDIVAGSAGNSVITRINGRQAATITGVITDTNVGGVSQAVREMVDTIALEPGVEVEAGGVFTQIAEGFREMLRSVGIAIVLVYIVMVVSLRSFLNPFIIILSLPLASVGAISALAITQRTLGMPALLGILMLVGLVVTNAIVLITFVQQLRNGGMGTREALMEAGRLRVRPIVMTAITTILVLFPLSLGLTEGTLIGAELATVVIGGLLTSTVLTLVVIPVVYSLFDGLRRSNQPAAIPAGGSIDEATD